jgi:hypothetical protein
MSLETQTASGGDGPAARRWFGLRREVVAAIAAVVLLPALAYLGVWSYDAASGLTEELPDPCAAFVAGAEALPPRVVSVVPTGQSQARPDRRTCQLLGPSFRAGLEYGMYQRDWFTSPAQAADEAMRARVDEILRGEAEPYSWKNALSVADLGDSAVGYAAGGRPDENRLTFIGVRRGNAVVLIHFVDYVDTSTQEAWLRPLIATAFSQIRP